NLSPQAAIDAGAQWNLDGGDWQDSGAILQASIGEHTINYKNISHSSWIAPASDEVTISVVGMSLERSYQWDPPEEGMLKVSITPQGAIDAGARWRVDGQVPWYESGQTATVSQGTHTVSFTDVPCWAKPEEFEVYVPAGQLVTENVVYTGVCETPSAVIMSISPSPADPQSDTVQFRENSTDNDEGGNSIEYWKWTSNLGKYDGNFTLYQSNTSGDFDLSANDLQVGTHTITLYVEDNEDDFDSTTETLTVTNVKPVIDSFSVNKGAEDSFIFTGTAHDRDENQQSITGWQIGIAGLSYSNTLMAGAGNLNYAFNSSGLAAGAYSVSVVAIDDENAPSDPVTYTIEIGMLSCDINADQNVNYADFSTIASWWMLACSGPDWCGGSDFNRSGYINNDDLLYFAENWLENNSDPSLTLLLNEPLSGLRARTSIVADINHDGQQELVVGALMSDGTPVVKIYSVSGTVLSELWSYSISDAPKDGIVGVCVGDVDNDGVPELAVHTATYRDGQIRIFEKGTGNTWTQVWSEASRSDHSPDDLSIGDCDNDGLNELVVGKSYGNRRVYVYDHSGGDSYARTITPLPGTDYRSVWVGDLKGNGSNVILAGTAFWGSAPVIVAEYNGSSYASIWTMSDSQQNFQETKGGNVDTDGDNEIVVSTSKGWGSKTAVRVYDYAGNNSWSQSWIYQEGNWNFYRAPEVGNLIPWNGCNEFFVAASDSGNNRIYMFDNYGGSYRVAWMESLSGSVNDSCVGDVDNDGKDELVLLSGSSVIVYEY
ncbi:MAG: VCBS repeat-containing protein, partial [Anaerohalosphaera sp.]|nr:VCBS repeat-containing protein [Anaerohalosphaera sp.]